MTTAFPIVTKRARRRAGLTPTSGGYVIVVNAALLWLARQPRLWRLRFAAHDVLCWLGRHRAYVRDDVERCDRPQCLWRRARR